MRILILSSALPKTAEICGTIPTDTRRSVGGRGRRPNGNGLGEGRNEESHPGANGERGDCERTGGRADWQRERMNR